MNPYNIFIFVYYHWQEHAENNRKSYAILFLLLFFIAIIYKNKVLRRINKHGQLRWGYLFRAPILLRTISTNNGTIVHADIRLILGNRVLMPLESKAIMPTEQLRSNKQPKSRELLEIEKSIDNAFGPLILISNKLLSLGLRTMAEEAIIQSDDLKTFTVKLFADIIGKTKSEHIKRRNSQECGYEAFIKDHYLLPKLMGHPEMTLAKISRVYPGLPYPKYLKKNVNLKVILGAWLPFLSEYGRKYHGGTNDSGRLVRILNNIFAQLLEGK